MLYRSKGDGFARSEGLLVPVIAQGFDDAALLDAAVRTACQHALKLSFQGRQAGNALLSGAQRQRPGRSQSEWAQLADQVDEQAQPGGDLSAAGIVDVEAWPRR